MEEAPERIGLQFLGYGLAMSGPYGTPEAILRAQMLTNLAPDSFYLDGNALWIQGYEPDSKEFNDIARLVAGELSGPDQAS